MAHGGGSSERWLITYADLITLLMVFFVVLYSISEADKDKYLALKSSLQRALNGDSSTKISVINKDSGQALLDSQRAAATDTISTKQNPGDNPISPMDTTSKIPDGEKIGQIRQVMSSLAQEQGVSDSVEVFLSDEGLVISLSGNLLFGSGRAELKPEGTVFLDSIAEVVHSWPNRLRIEGHTDSVPINSDVYPSNWELSTARAVVVTRYLVEARNLDPSRVGAAGYAEFRSVADNGSRDGRQRNRRVDVLILGVTKPDTGVAPGGWVDPSITTQEPVGP